jgi:hypothetical protein
MRITGALLIIGALLAATVADDSWAGRGGGGRGGFGGRSAAAGASRSGGWHGPGHMHFPHHSHGSVFFVGGSYWGYPYYWSPYYSAPYAVVVPYQDPDVVYVERFDGTPTPQTAGEIFCPNTDAYYPDVESCPGGWQRVTRPPGEAPGAGG